MTRAVLFDLDETLFDHETATGSAVIDTLREVWGIVVDDPEDVRRQWCQFIEHHVGRYLRNEIDWYQQRRDRVRDLVEYLGSPEPTESGIRRWLDHYVARYEEAWRLFPDATETLEALRCRGIRLGIVTNGDAGQQRRKIDRTGLDKSISTVVISGQLGVAKPDPRIFAAACRDIGVAPSSAVYVGDRLDTDARGAVGAGMHGVWLDRGDSATTADVPRIVTLSVLPALVDDLLA